MWTIERDLKAVEDMLNLRLAKGYVKKLLDNQKVVKFLNLNYPDLLSEFQSIATADTV